MAVTPKFAIAFYPTVVLPPHQTHTDGRTASQSIVTWRSGEASAPSGVARARPGGKSSVGWGRLSTCRPAQLPSRRPRPSDGPRSSAGRRPPPRV
jgi:hypothetical protein